MLYGITPAAAFFCITTVAVSLYFNDQNSGGELSAKILRF